MQASIEGTGGCESVGQSPVGMTMNATAQQQATLCTAVPDEDMATTSAPAEQPGEEAAPLTAVTGKLAAAVQAGKEGHA